MHKGDMTDNQMKLQIFLGLNISKKHLGEYSTLLSDKVTYLTFK